MGAYSKPTRQGKATSIPEIVAGFVLLGTIFLPWAAVKNEVVMSWDVLTKAPASVNVFLIGAWIIGLATIVVGFSVKDLALGVVYAGLGFLGIILLLVVVSEIPDSPAPFKALGSSNVAALGMLSTICLVCLIIAANLFIRVGRKLAIRILQGTFAGALAILSLVGLLKLIGAYSDLPGFVRRSEVAVDFVILLLLQLASITACVLMLVQAASVKIRKPTLVYAGLLTIYSVLAATALYLIIRPAQAADMPGLALAVLNCVMIVGSIFLLFCGGVIRSAAHLIHAASRVQPTRAAIQAGPAQRPPKGILVADPQTTADAQLATTALEARLANLTALRREGAISEEEYVLARSRILGEV